MTHRTPSTKRALTVILTGSLLCLLPSIALAAGGGHGDHHFPRASVAASWVNFAIFLGILVYFAKDSIQTFFSNRKELLEANLKEAERLREEAQAKLEEYQAKLDQLEQEREELLEEYNRQGEREKIKIIEDAKNQVEKMREDAERVIEQEVKKVIASLEQRAVDHAVRLAKDMAKDRLDSEDKQSKLVDGYVEDLASIDSLSRRV